MIFPTLDLSKEEKAARRRWKYEAKSCFVQKQWTVYLQQDKKKAEAESKNREEKFKLSVPGAFFFLLKKAFRPKRVGRNPQGQGRHFACTK
jgi:hypothetical protein